MPLFDAGAAARAAACCRPSTSTSTTTPSARCENLQASGTNRGEAIQQLNERLFAALRDGAGSGRRVPGVPRRPQRRLHAAGVREAGGPRAVGRRPQLTGYDKIALSVIRAIHENSDAVIPLSVRNRGNIPELRDEDVVEVPCAVNANGALPLHVGAGARERARAAAAGEGVRAADGRGGARAARPRPRARRSPATRWWAAPSWPSGCWRALA